MENINKTSQCRSMDNPIKTIMHAVIYFFISVATTSQIVQGCRKISPDVKPAFKVSTIFGYVAQAIVADGDSDKEENLILSY